MSDYYALISNGITALDIKTSEARREYYDRARAIMADHCRKADPPLSEAFIEDERQALDDAISKVEADAMRSEGTAPIPNGLQTQSDSSERYVRNTTVEASSIKPDAKLQRQRRLAFGGFLILYALWIGDLFYEWPTLSNWYDWFRLGGVIFLGAMTILSYFIVLKNWSAEQEERAYIVWASIIFVGTVLASGALYFTFKWFATIQS